MIMMVKNVNIHKTKGWRCVMIHITTLLYHTWTPHPSAKHMKIKFNKESIS
jgi:hypothetical protein